MSLTMYDAVDAAAIPLSAKYACFYTDGHYANGTAVKARLPHATLLSITVFGGVADCCDCETGDLTVAQAEVWVAKRLAAGAHRPCVYANLDRWENQGLKAGLAKYGSRIRRWVAHYDNVAAIPPGYDAKQYRSTRPLDTSICAPNFFSVPKPPAPKPKPPAPKPKPKPKPPAPKPKPTPPPAPKLTVAQQILAYLKRKFGP